MKEDLPVISESDFCHMRDVCFTLPYDEERLAEDIDDFFEDFDGYIDYENREDVAALIEIASNIPVYEQVIVEEFPNGTKYYEAGKQIAFLDLSKEISEFIEEQREMF